MKVILHDKNIFILRFDTNEEVIQGIADFCTAQAIASGFFSAIGAVKDVLLSYYNLETKQYQDKKIVKDVEIVSMLGNIAAMDGKSIIHCHGSIADTTYAVMGGHIKKIIVSATCEVSLTALEGTVVREYHQETGLNLMV